MKLCGALRPRPPFLLAALVVTATVAAAARPAPAAAPPEGPAKFFPPAPPVAPGVKPSVGCQQPTITTGTRQKRIAVDGVNRNFMVVVPAGTQPQSPLPLVLAWHGLGDSGLRARVYYGVEQQTHHGALFIYPDGLPLATQGNRPGWELRPGGRDVRFFDALIKEASTLLCFDEARVFAIGHGAGGDFANALACHRPAVLRGIATVGSGLPSDACPGKGVATWSAHGKNDGMVPFTRGAAARDHWLAANGCIQKSRAVSPASCLAFEGCADKAPVQFCAYGGGDDWPTFAGPAIWKFFAALK
jgi:polyhydroxybutyrate depolymerase